jgi:sigma-B regulation protein RsbU (phosphoserine phosphatase)
MKKSRSFSVKLKIILVILFIVAMLICLMLTTIINMNNNYKELTLNAYRSSVAKKCAEIDRDIFKIESTTYELADKGRVLYQTNTVETLGEETVIGSFSGQDIAVGGGIWFEPDAEGGERICFYAYRDENGGIVLDPSFASAAYDYPTQEWYEEIKTGSLAGERYVWTKPYIDETGTQSLMTTVGCPIYDDAGTFLGMTTSDWKLDAIAESIKGLGTTKNSFSIFANPASDNILASAAKTKNDVETAMPDSLSALEWFGPAVEEGSVELDGVEFLVASSALRNGMIAAIFVPEDELYDKANKEIYAMILLLTIAVAVIGYGSYLLLQRFISAPISRITREIAAIGGGDLDRKIDIKTRDEFGVLAETFNDMTDDLKTHIRNLTAVTSEKERIGAELMIATEIQESLLPTTFPAFPDRTEFDLYAMMHPAKEVGGDFYDFYYTDKDRLALVIADVSGKGVPAALFMIVAKILLKNHLQTGESPDEALKNVNNQLCENNDAGMFVTAFVAVFSIKTGEVEYANAGHNPPLVMREGEPVAMLRVKPGFVLGGMSDISYEKGAIQLNAGDILYLYTDGVTEAENAKNELFGEERMLAVANLAGDGPARALVERMSDAVEEFAGGAPQFDDITMLALKYGRRHAKRKVEHSGGNQPGKPDKQMGNTQ